MLEASGLFDRLRDACHLERLRRAVMHLGAVRDETQDDPLGFGGVGRPEHLDSIRLEGGGGPLHAGVARQGSKPPDDRRIEGRLELSDHVTSCVIRPYTCICNYLSGGT